MAHFSVLPPSLTKVFFLVAMVATLLLESNQTRAAILPDQKATKLITKTCTESLEPQICSQCLTSEHTRQFDNIPGFIHSLLMCMRPQVQLAHDKANNLASQKSTSPSLKRTLSICSSALNDAVSEVEHALVTLDLSHYTDAWNDAMAARRMWFRCALEFHGNADFTIPSPLLSPMVNANRLFDASYGLFVLIV